MLKKLAGLALLVLFSGAVFAQQNYDGPTPQKYALVIDNSAYISGLSPLANPVNDANDIGTVLEYLGFSVEKVLNGSNLQNI